VLGVSMNEIATFSFSCPTCGGNVQHSRLYEKNGCTIYSCQRCGIARTKTPPLFDAASIYDQSYFAGGHSDGYTDYIGSESVLRREFAHTVSVLKKHCRPSSKVLELGCAYGVFLSEAKATYDVAGIEISEIPADYARRRGLHVLTGIADRENLDRIGKVDAIVLLDVIEHLTDPYETLALCKSYLNPCGIIMFTTGDFGSVYARATDRNWRLMTPPQHLYFFTRKSVESLSKRLGMIVERLDHPWKTVPLSLILYQLPRVLGIKSMTTSLTFGDNIGLPINLFDAMRVVLRTSEVD
jgi:SAM-dependent methyltransferase